MYPIRPLQPSRSKLVDLLIEGTDDVSLEQILDEDDVIQEIKGMNPTLLQL